MKNQWFIALKERGPDLFDTSGFKKIEPPKGRYHADPFLFEHEDLTYLFFEDYDYDKGSIAYSIITAFGLTVPKIILKKKYHLSFPTIIEDEGQIFLIPESGANNTIDIYHFKNFPAEPKKVRTLMRGPAPEDVTVFKFEDYWWLFVTFGGPHNLKIFRAKELLSNWELTEDRMYRDSRSAGKPFIYEGEIIRPVQDCEESYGHGIIFKKISLNPYTETQFKTIEPDWFPNLTGTHTFTFTNKYVAIDGRIKINDKKVHKTK